jgi:hypothetical protein
MAIAGSHYDVTGQMLDRCVALGAICAGGDDVSPAKARSGSRRVRDGGVHVTSRTILVLPGVVLR